MVFSHGKESGPWGAKITAMAAVVRELKLAVESVDYRGMDDPAARVEKLIAVGPRTQGPAGAGGLEHGRPCVRRRGEPPRAHAACSCWRRLSTCRASKQYTPQDVAVPTAIVHGWHDDIVPVENSIRWAREHRATLHMLDSDHRLEDQIERDLHPAARFLDRALALAVRGYSWLCGFHGAGFSRSGVR